MWDVYGDLNEELFQISLAQKMSNKMRRFIYMLIIHYITLHTLYSF